MIKLAANLSMMFQDRPFLDRFQAAADAGFKGVECHFPYEASPGELKTRLSGSGVRQVLFNTPPGDWASGERGIAALPSRVAEFRDSVRVALEYALATNCKLLHVMAGTPDSSDSELVEQTFRDNVRFAGHALAKEGITALIEPVNTKVDFPGYFLHSTSQAEKVISQLGLPNVRLQFDCYHLQIMEGDLARSIERLLPLIAHIQLADNPGRHEPGTGEINYAWLLGKIDSLRYSGWIGCEYRPVADTVLGLGWAAPYIGARR